MDLTILISGGIGAAVSIIGTLATIKLNQKKGTQDDFTILRDSYAGDFKRMRAELDKLKKEEITCQENYLALELKFNTLASHMKLLEIATPQMDVPTWMKDENGIMMALNDAYESCYLAPLNLCRADYIGKDDVQMWGTEIGKMYQAGDQEVITKSKPIGSMEPITTKTGIKYLYVIKYPISVAGINGKKHLVGIGGHTIDAELVNSMNTAATLFDQGANHPSPPST